MMSLSFIRTFVIVFILALGQQSYAANAYYDYVADFYLNESHQARNPNDAIEYADGEKGALLQSVLEPARVKKVLSLYIERMKKGEKDHDIPKLLRPLTTRYDAAFKKDSRAYENEYLDSLEVSAEVIEMVILTMNASKLPVVDNSSGAENEKEKAMMDKLQSLVKMSRDMAAAANKVMAADIRSMVAKGMFSESGAKRALTIADRFSPK